MKNPKKSVNKSTSLASSTLRPTIMAKKLLALRKSLTAWMAVSIPTVITILDAFKDNLNILQDSFKNPNFYKYAMFVLSIVIVFARSRTMPHDEKKDSNA